LTETVREQKSNELTNPEQTNYERIERLEGLLRALRANPSTARETEAIREIGLEVAIPFARWADADQRRLGPRTTGAVSSRHLSQPGSA
jgi:hypothetical protein